MRYCLLFLLLVSFYNHKTFACDRGLKTLIDQTAIGSQIRFTDQLVAMRLQRMQNRPNVDVEAMKKTIKILGSYLTGETIVARLCNQLDKDKTLPVGELLELLESKDLKEIFAVEAKLYTITGQGKLRSFTQAEGKKIANDSNEKWQKFSTATRQVERNVAISIGLSQGFLLAMADRKKEQLDIEKISHYQRKVVAEQVSKVMPIQTAFLFEEVSDDKQRKFFAEISRSIWQQYFLLVEKALGEVFIDLNADIKAAFK